MLNYKYARITVDLESTKIYYSEVWHLFVLLFLNNVNDS